MEIQVAEPPVIASIEDISRDLANGAYRGTSFSPEKRGDAERAEYASVINGFYAEVYPMAISDQQKELLAGEMERYRQGYLNRLKSYLSSRSRCMSPMITGPARFPVDRNRKRFNSADKRSSELLEWSKKVKGSIISKMKDSRSSDEKFNEEWDSVRRRLEDSLKTIRAIDEGREPYSRSLFVSNLSGRIERMAMHGSVEIVRKVLEVIEQHNGMVKKPLITKRHKIWSFLGLAERVAAKFQAELAVKFGSEERQELSIIAEVGEIKIIRNVEAGRVQIKFPGKPAAEMIGKLKSEGWRWSPSNGVWQRQLTVNAQLSAKRIIGVN